MGDDSKLVPRCCTIGKWADFNGYGFNLHAERGKAGQYIGKVDDDSPAQAAGLKEGDRIVEVNGVNIGNENHSQVVNRIKAGGDSVTLLVVDSETDKYYKDEKIVVSGDRAEVLRLTTPPRPGDEPEPEPAEPEPPVEPPSYNDVQEADKQDEEEVQAPPTPERTPTPEPEPEVTVTSVTVNSVSSTSPSNPRLCHIIKWPDFQGYGFNLHAEKDKPGQYIGSVDNDSPAEDADLRQGDRIVAVNGVNVEDKSHSEVIQLIKAGGDETQLLVVDKAADEYYKNNGITVSESLPEVQSKKTRTKEREAPAMTFTPRQCHIRKWPDFPGYGFNLHAEKERGGQYIGKIDDGSPAQDGGLREGDRIIEVNGINIEDETHHEVIQRIKAGGDETKMLVVDREADAYYKQQGITVRSTMSEVKFLATTPRGSEVETTEVIDQIAVMADQTPEADQIAERVDQSVEADQQVAEPDQSVVEPDQTAVEPDQNLVEPDQHIAEPVQTEVVTDQKEEESAAPVTNGSEKLESPRPTSYQPPSVQKAAPAPAQAQANGGDFLSMNLSAKEMRERLQAKKKQDPKTKAGMDFRSKYEIFQKM